MSDQKFDVFVGNVKEGVTEEQLREIFSYVGEVRNVRILMDRETGRPKGFAFIEYSDANQALAAIRHLDGYELHNRKLRVSYSNDSNLKDIARQIGQAVPDVGQTGSKSEYHIVQNMKLHEAWDVLESMKKLIESDKSGQRTRTIFEAYPHLVGAALEIERKLGIIGSSDFGVINTSTNVNTNANVNVNTNVNTINTSSNYMPSMPIPPPPQLKAYVAAPQMHYDEWGQQQQQQQQIHYQPPPVYAPPSTYMNQDPTMTYMNPNPNYYY